MCHCVRQMNATLGKKRQFSTSRETGVISTGHLAASSTATATMLASRMCEMVWRCACVSRGFFLVSLALRIRNVEQR